MDGNTEEKSVQEKFINTLMETMKIDNFLVYQQDEKNSDGTVLQDLERPEVVGETMVGESTVPHQNGYIPNNTKNDQRQHLRYDVRNMYAQIGSFPNDTEL